MRTFYIFHIVLLRFLLVGSISYAQIFVGNNSSLHTGDATMMFLQGDFKNYGVLNNEGTIELIGNWDNPGVATPIGTVKFVGYNQLINHYANVFHTVVIDGGGQKQLASPMILEKSIVLEDGYVLPTPSAIVVLNPDARASAGSEFSYIQGAMYARNQSNPYFPIGYEGMVFLPAQLHNIVPDDSYVGVSVHEFETQPISGKRSRYVFDEYYWHLDTLTGDASNLRISLPSLPQYAAFDSLTIVHSPSLTEHFRGLGSDDSYASTIPYAYITSEDTAKGPYFALGILQEVDWKLFYIPTALSRFAPDPNDQTVKVYGNIFKPQDFKFTVTNHWGNVIFETTSLALMEEEGWKGNNLKTNRHEALGQYMYFLHAVTKDNEKFTKAGSIWIIE